MLGLFRSTRPMRMLCRVNMTFGVRHQTKHASARIANTGDVRIRTIRIVRKRQDFVFDTPLPCTPLRSSGVADGQPSLLPKLRQDSFAGSNKLSFGMRHRQIHPLDIFQENARCVVHSQMNPTILEASVIVPRQRRRRLPRLTHAFGQDTKSHQDLHSVTDSQDQGITIAMGEGAKAALSAYEYILRG